MSKLLEKASALEAKEKWKNAASAYHKAASAFKEEGKIKETKSALLKAFSNAGKANESQLVLEYTFELASYLSEEEKKGIYQKALPYLDNLIAEARDKNKTDLIAELMKKKVQIVEVLQQKEEETKIVYSESLQHKALEYLSNRKSEKRAIGLESLAEASNLLLSLEKKEERIAGETIAVISLIGNGYLDEGLPLLTKLISFCKENNLSDRGTDTLIKVINLGKEVLLESGEKKLASACKSILDKQNPGEAFLLKIIPLAREIDSSKSIMEIALTFEAHGTKHYNKKKPELALPSYNKSLAFRIEVEDTQATINLAESLENKAYELIDQKGLFSLALEYLDSLEQVAVLDQTYVGKMQLTKADQLFTRNHYKLSLEAYQKSAEAYIKADAKKDYTKAIQDLFTKAKKLIQSQDYTNALVYVQTAIDILEGIEAFELRGKELTTTAVELIKQNQIKEAEEYAARAVEDLVKADNNLEAANSHKILGETLLGLEIFDEALFHLVEGAVLYKAANKNASIHEIISLLLIAAKNKLTADNTSLATQLKTAAKNAAKQVDAPTEAKLLVEYAEHAIELGKVEIGLENYSEAVKALDINHPAKTLKISKNLMKVSKDLTKKDKNFSIANQYIIQAINASVLISNEVNAAEIILKASKAFFKEQQNELARDLLVKISSILNNETQPVEFAVKTTIAAELLAKYQFYDEAIEQFQKAVGTYISQGASEPVSDIITFCTKTAKKALAGDKLLGAKYLYKTAMEFSLLIDLEQQDSILTEATAGFLEKGELFVVKELYDFAQNNLEGEKDYLGKLGRLVVYQGGILRDQKQLFNDAVEFIKIGVSILRTNGMLEEAGEAAIAQGKSFIEMEKYLLGDELIEISAEIFIELDDLERSGEAFLALSESSYQRGDWQSALRQANLALKSFMEINSIQKTANSLLQKAKIAADSLVANPETNQAFALECFETTTKEVQQTKMKLIEADIYILQARAFFKITNYQSTAIYYNKATEILEELNENDKSMSLAEELSINATKCFQENVTAIGQQLVDLAARIYIRLEKPVTASEVYMKGSNDLLKSNNIVDSVQMVLQATDTLIIADEVAGATSILEEWVDLLVGLKDYERASICTGQIVTIHQKTGDTETQKNAIHKLVKVTAEVIKEGKIMEGESLWEQAANYSISVNIDFALEINNARVENLLANGMYNAANTAFKQVLPILEKDNEHLLILAEKVASIASELFVKEEVILSKNFVQTAVDYYKKAETLDQARDLCIMMSESFIVKGDEQSGIDLIDTAAILANEMDGSHAAAKVYLTQGFVLIEHDFLESGKLATKKAIDIELQAKNLGGCTELGEIAMKKAAELMNSNEFKAIDVYNLAITIFDSAKQFSKAGEACVIIATKRFNAGEVENAVAYSERAVDYFLDDKNIEAAVAGAKHALESAQRLMNKNELPKAVFILERGKILVERIGQYELLSLIISIYLSAATQQLPNRKSSIGIFFLRRAIDLANSSPVKEEIERVIGIVQQITIDVIKKKNSLAGAKALEIITSQKIEKESLVNDLIATYILATQLTLDSEWNLTVKVAMDALEFIKENEKYDKITALIDLFLVRINTQLLMTNSTAGFFFLDQAIRLAAESKIPELMIHVGISCYDLFEKLENEGDMNITYKLLGYCYHVFFEVKSMENIERIGFEFAKFGSKELLNNLFSLRGYEALITARDIAVQVQNPTIMSNVVLGLLDLANKFSSKNVNASKAAIEDVIDGLESYQIPASNRVPIKIDQLEPLLKSLISFAEKVAKKDSTYILGKSMVETCYRIYALTDNEPALEKIITNTRNNLSKLLRRANIDSATKIKHTAIVLIDLLNNDEARRMAEELFKAAEGLTQKRKYSDCIFLIDAIIAINEKLNLTTELRNIASFSLKLGEMATRDGKIHEAMGCYDLAIEAFDKANDDESANRVINMIFQQREWDADVTIAYRCYQYAAKSAVRKQQIKKAQEVARKCFNRGHAFIEQPRIPPNITYRFITLAGKTMEDIGAIKEAANIYDQAILKYISIMRSTKNIDQLIAELLIKTAVNRMASCDMDSLETILLRVRELAEMKKSDETNLVTKVLKLINSEKIKEAWTKIASVATVSHGRIRKVINATKQQITEGLAVKGVFDRTVFSSTDRSAPLFDYLIVSLQVANRISGIKLNKDIFLAQEKLNAIRKHLSSEYSLWGRIEINAVAKEFNLKPIEIIALLRKEFIPSLYMGILDKKQQVLYSTERLKAEISLVINKEKKKESMFNPVKLANEMSIKQDTIKEIIRELTCEEVVEKALEQ